MNFVSLEFFLFFPLVLFIYWFLPAKFRWILLLAASYFFYLYWNPWTLFLLLGTTLISYIASRKIAGSTSKPKRNFWLILALVACLGCLIIFKYLGFLTENITALLKIFGAPSRDIVITIFLPIGISFYTFQTLSYVIDVYRGDIKPETHLGYYALFISFFPQLVAGPIERPANLLPQLRAPHKLKGEDLVAGLLITLRGFFKKLVIADYVATFVDVVYGTPDLWKGSAIVLATVLFAFQIYCDFSGYSDIAVGVARMMGIGLMNNFNDPYSATSIQDFWRRWHISLTSWFTDYIYKPLGGSRRGGYRRCINILIVFFISGAWHGASWTYIIWGSIHGIYLVVGFLWRNYMGIKKQTIPSGMARIYRSLLTFTLVCFAWIFFRANSLGDLGILLGNLYTGWSVVGFKDTFQRLEMDVMDMIRLALMFACLPLLQKVSLWQALKLGDIHTLKSSSVSVPCSEGVHIALMVFVLVILIGLAWLSLLSMNADSSFIYFQF